MIIGIGIITIVSIAIHVYIYIYIERERDREIEKNSYRMIYIMALRRGTSSSAGLRQLDRSSKAISGARTYVWQVLSTVHHVSISQK